MQQRLIPKTETEEIKTGFDKPGLLGALLGLKDRIFGKTVESFQRFEPWNGKGQWKCSIRDAQSGNLETIVTKSVMVLKPKFRVKQARGCGATEVSGDVMGEMLSRDPAAALPANAVPVRYDRDLEGFYVGDKQITEAEAFICNGKETHVIL